MFSVLLDQRHSKIILVVCGMVATISAISCRSKTDPVGENQESRRPVDDTAKTVGVPLDKNEFTANGNPGAIRRDLDAKIWADEVRAQHYEQYFVQLWDLLRKSKDKNKILEDLSIRELSYKPPVGVDSLEHGILRFRLADKLQNLAPSGWRRLTSKLRQNGFQLLETEWHHSKFEPTASPPRSQVGFLLHLARPLSDEGITDTSPQQRAIVRGNLHVTWNDEDVPTPDTIRVDDLEILVRTGKPAFQHMMTCRRNPDEYSSAHPIIVYDLNGDGFPEIVISRWNRVYWNEQGTTFRESKLFDHFQPLAETGLIADVTSDQIPDFVSINRDGQLIVYRGTKNGQFPDPPYVAATINAPETLALTAGDIDTDGDADLWVTQYKPSYVGGQMPTPYYDANDGKPSFLLVNDGKGNFADMTVDAGLADKRNRRTYSSSFVDLDDDDDLDLLVVSDYAGIDLYSNDGKGQFDDVTESQLPSRNLFGMAHTMADFNGDAKLDFYAIGMSSTTARRLDQMGLGRKDFPDVHQMRPEMGYGNRMLLRKDQSFVASPHSADVARTGWSWGTTATDFDLDGDRDIYVANGFRSGDSSKDYCTTYWTHDIYTGSSTPNENLAMFFANNMKVLNSNAISWNGYEHNSLLLNRRTNGFMNVAFLFGVGFEYDSRAVIGADLDRDGKPDLLVAEYEFVGQGFELSLHVYRNTLETNNNWIGIDLSRANRLCPLGAKISVTTTGQTQVAQYVTGDSFLSQHPATVHFGLGKDQVESVKIRWSNGTVEERSKLEPKQYLKFD